MFFEHYTQVPEGYWRWKNFSPKEIACKGTGKLLVDERSMDMLQELRDAIGKPLFVNSGYRSPEHNRKVKGAPNSFHLRGRAFDISNKRHSVDTLVSTALSIGFMGVGYYNTFVHLDTRNYDAEWRG
jgi:uncharacterized protein YcbK (DUF882 family)